jgi:hypothetical protein
MAARSPAGECGHLIWPRLRPLSAGGAVCRAAGLMPIDAGGNLIFLMGRDGAF